jgi:4-hydroxybenzoyl-CoA thioesterase
MPKFIHKVPVRIAWGDCDPAQIVFYPRYFAMFDNSTDQIFRAALGMPKKEWTKKFGFIGFPMVDTRAKFHVPTGYGDDVVIETQVTEFRSSSFDVVHRLMKGDKLAVEAWETRVLVGPDPDKPGGIKSKAIPPEVLAAFDRT